MTNLAGHTGSWRAHALASALLAVTLFTVALDVYSRNISEFAGSSILQLLPPVLISIVVGCMAFVITGITGLKPLGMSVVLGAAACVIAASQGVTTSVIPPIDGGTHPYIVSSERGVVEFILLFVIFLLTAGFAILRLREALVILSGLTFLAVLIPIYNLAARDRISTSLGPLMTLSRDVNVIHIMFDSLQSDAFKQIAEQQPDLLPEFDGFTYYPDHAGYANWTTLSIAAIQTGRLFFDQHQDGMDPIEEIGEWLRSSSMMSHLADKGWDVSAVQPSNAFCFRTKYYCSTLPFLSNSIGQRLGKQRKSNPLIVVDLALLRLAPTLLKPLVYNEGKLLWSDATGPANADSSTANDIALSMDFAKILTEDIAVTDDNPVYKFLHFYPPHKPFILDEDCRIGAARTEDWPNYLPQATCAVKQMAGILQALKRLGAYDNSVIIFQSDTGLGMVRPTENADPKITSVVEYSSPQLVGYARPTLLIKPLGATGPLRVSSGQTSHLNTFSLINDATAGRTNLPNVTAPKDRSFVVSRIIRAGTTSVSPYEQFSIVGNVADSAAWQYGGMLSRPGVPYLARPIQSATFSIDADEPLKLNQSIRLVGSVRGGNDVEYTFLRRIRDDKLEVIKDWSSDNTATWEVDEDGMTPCVANILMAARNRVMGPSEQQINVEKVAKISASECH
ncbi:sulfatase-like hydrolase/transferase [Rhizobium laguerreae]|nr:sulfatase-like hydrolase/transferase [Rhizobium laguerreae]